MTPTREEVERIASGMAEENPFTRSWCRHEAAEGFAALAAENAALRERLEAAEACNRGLVRLNEATEARAKDLQAALTEARAREAAAWEAVEPIRSLIELTECGEITGLHWADEFGLYLLGDDGDPVYCAVKLTFEQLGKIAPTAPTNATAALTARLDAEWNAAIEAAADTSKNVGKPFARAFVLRRLSGSGYNVGFRAKQRVCVQIARRIRALRRNPKEGK